MRHLIVWIVMLLAIFALASCRKQAPVPAPKAPSAASEKPAAPAAPATPAPSPAETYRTSDGLQITPLKGTYEEIADILDMQRWSFRVVTPSPDSRVKYAIELRKKGQPGANLVSGILRGVGGSDGQVTVALYPFDGPIQVAQNVKAYARVGASTSSNVIRNPVKDFGGYSALSPAKHQDDESFVLMELTQSGNSPDTATLVLTLHVAPAETKQL